VVEVEVLIEPVAAVEVDLEPELLYQLQQEQNIPLPLELVV
jgi:hypothetical protein